MFAPFVTVLLCALFVVMWSSGFIGAKYGLDDAGTMTLLFWRYLLLVATLVALATVFRQWRRISALEWGRHAVIGISAHAVWLIAVLVALDHGVSPGIAAFVTALQPMVTAAVAGPFVGEHPTPRQWLGVAVGIGSVGLVVADKVALGGSAVAHLLPFVAVLGISLGTLVDRRIRSHGRQVEDAPILMTTAIHAMASLAVITPFAWLLEGFAADVTPNFVFSVVWLAFVVSLAAYGLMFVLLRRMEATRVSSLMYLSPPVTMVIGYLTFGDRLTMADVAGLALAAVAVGLVNMRIAPHKLATAEGHT